MNQSVTRYPHYRANAGSFSDEGAVVHSGLGGRTLCGRIPDTRPGQRISTGGRLYEGYEVTCKRCLRSLQKKESEDDVEVQWVEYTDTPFEELDKTVIIRKDPDAIHRAYEQKDMGLRPVYIGGKTRAVTEEAVRQYLMGLKSLTIIHE